MNLTKNIALLISSIIFVFIIFEIGLRILGEKVDKKNIVDTSHEPIIYEKHDEIGWVHKEGSYKFLPWSEYGKITNFNINKDLSRSAENASKNEEKIIFIGGSLTQGWAVDDNENFVSIIQNKTNNYNTINFGVGGYGGYQSLLLLEKIIKFDKLNYVIYGFIKHHEYRNVASGSWVYLLNKFSGRGHVKIPYADIDKQGNLIRNLPIGKIKIPFSDYSVFLSKIEKKILKMKSQKREKKRFDISKKIILNMKQIVENKNGKFIFLNLNNMSEIHLSRYKKFLKTNNIEFFNCPFPVGKEFSVIGEGHPNEKGHFVVAECILKKIEGLTNT